MNEAEPLAAEPLATEPFATEPSSTEPLLAEPLQTEPKVTESETAMESALGSILKNQLSQAEKVLSEEFIEKLSSNIASKVVELQNLEMEKQKESTEDNSYWNEHDDCVVCHPCLLYSKSLEVPDKLRSTVRGSYGVLKKESKSKRNKAAHCNLSLHVWWTQPSGHI